MSSGNSDRSQGSGETGSFIPVTRRWLTDEEMNRVEQANVATLRNHLQGMRLQKEAEVLEGATIRFYRTEEETLRATICITGEEDSLTKEIWQGVQSAVRELAGEDELIETFAIVRGAVEDGPHEGEDWEFIVLSPIDRKEKGTAAPPASSRPWDGIKWEQVTVPIMGGMGEAELDKILARYGEEGWELVTAVLLGPGCRLFFKRPKRPEG